MLNFGPQNLGSRGAWAPRAPLDLCLPRVQGGEHVKTMSPIHSFRDFFHSIGIVSVKPRNASECGLVISAISVSTTPEHKCASSFK